MVFKERTVHGREPGGERDSNGAPLEATVADGLAALPGADASDVTVVVSGSVVTLGGFARSTEEVERMVSAARSFAGVTRVISKIKTEYPYSKA